MPRTPEEKAADDALHEAIEACLTIRGYKTTDTEDEEVPMATVHWMVLVEQRGYDRNGEAFSGIIRLLQDGDMPWSTRFGLLHMETTRTEAEFNA